MQQFSRIERRSLLTGWIKWALLPAIPFCVIFFDAWLNVQVRYKDYDISRLNAVRRNLNVELDLVRAKEASISGVEFLTEIAEQMELASPMPQQFRTITYREAPRRIPVMNLAQTPVPAAQPVVINLDKPVTAALAKNVSEQNAENGVAPGLITAPRNDLAEVAPAESGEALVYGDLASAQPYAPTQDIYEDLELSLLTVEDMLGRL